MDKKPIISVVMSAYNAEKYIKEAIESILSQTYTDFEFIIINDGSTDGTHDIIKAFTDPRIRLITRENKGLIASLNEGIAKAHGTYIARMDADDITEPTRFEKQIDFLRASPEITLCGTWAMTIDADGKELGLYDYPPKTHNAIQKAILRFNPFIHPSVMFTKKALEQIGLYNKNYKHAEDYELWTRMVAKYKTANIPEPLIRYRITSESITQQNWGKMIRKGFRIRILALMRIWLKIPI